MKLLYEQKLYLKKRQEELEKEKSSILERKSEIHKFSDHYKSIDRDLEIYGESLSEICKEMDRNDRILQVAEVITNFNNHQIDIGTTFEVKFSDFDSAEKFTIVEIPLGGAFNSVNGYITVESLIGNMMIGRKAGEFFSEVVDGRKIEGTILQIIQKEPIQLEEKKRESNCLGKIIDTEELIERKYPLLKKKKRLSHSYNVYKRQLKEASTIASSHELERMDQITKSQELYLKDYLSQLQKERKKFVSGTSLDLRTSSRISTVKIALNKDILVPERFHQVELGRNVILEVTLPSGERKILDKELIACAYGREEESNFLSIQDTLGIYAYQKKLGETFVLKKSPTQEHLFVRVAQFGMQRERLLIPASANLSEMTDLEEKRSNFRKTYQETYFPMMTFSQQNLLEEEFRKVKFSSGNSPYTEQIYALKALIEKGYYPVQTKEQLESNGDRIGIGSKVSYMTVDKEIKSTELIACAFTKEEEGEYTEVGSPLGMQLFGKKEKDCFSLSQQGNTITGMILSVDNCPVIKKHLENGCFYTKTK